MIFLVRHVLKPLCFVTVGTRLLDSQVDKDSVGSRAVPVPFARIDPNGISRANFSDRAGPFLDPSYTGENV